LYTILPFGQERTYAELLYTILPFGQERTYAELLYTILPFGQGAENRFMRSYLVSSSPAPQYLYLGLAVRDESGLSEWPS
ncbi:hypothetical protein P4K96_13140, partial [Bacillus cereus]|nr:hypothetical protein [Bacillus cereus]